MLSSSFASSGSENSTAKRKSMDSPDNINTGFHNSGSIAKRRRTPASSEALVSIATTPPISIPMPVASNGLFGFHHAQDAILHHPLPQQPVQMSPLCQLNTPPVEAYCRYNSPAPISRPQSVSIDDDEMMLDDAVSINSDMNALSLQLYRPPSPLTPLQSNLKRMGPFGRSPSLAPVESAISSSHYAGDNVDTDDPMAQVWNRRSRNEVRRKNLDGEVIGYKMGFLADCAKCQMKLSGHSGHFIRKNHSV